jgi:hypothetical protein
MTSTPVPLDRLFHKMFDIAIVCQTVGRDSSREKSGETSKLLDESAVYVE